MANSSAADAITGSDIAIIGMSARLPGARDIEAFWSNLCAGAHAITFFSDEECRAAGVDPTLLQNPNYVKARGVLEDVELFDAAFFGFSPREAEIRDPQHRLFLECAWEALEQAGYDPETYEGTIGVYAGVSPNTYLLHNLLSNPSVVELVGPLHLTISSDKDFLTTLVSYKLHLRGPSIVVQTACSTSLVAACLACQSLLSYQCDMALVGGASIKVPHRVGYLYQAGGVLSPDGYCRAFDAAAQGSVDSNGVGVVVLKRLADALTDGDHIYAVIKGSAINNDGALKVSYTAPSVDGQAEVIAMAQAVAGVTPDTITYVETHGAGTPLGDPIEIAALTQVFRSSTAAKGSCAIGSVKGNIGHLDTAAGVAGLIKTALMLKHTTLPPSLHFQQPNPQIDFANSPFSVNASLTAWNAGPTPRRAGVSSFGVGGTNAHMVLEEAPVMPPAGPSRPWQLLLLSAKTDTALERATDRLVDHLKQHPDLSLADIAYTLQIGRKAFRQRRMLVCRDLDDAVTALAGRDPERVLTSVQETCGRPIAFMFPGLGDHYIAMALELYQTEVVFRAAIDRSVELLKPLLDVDIRDVLHPNGTMAPVEPVVDRPAPRQGLDLRTLLNRGPRQADLATHALNQTVFAQPALFAIEYALAQLWMAWGIRPQAIIGHSLGEYVAACVAGVLSLEDALLLVARRAQMIQDLPTGAMLAVLLPEEALTPLLGSRLSLAAINAPSTCVVAGPLAEIDALERQLMQEGVASRRLQTTHAFHSTMMDPIVEPFTKLVKTVTLHHPTLPYISNVTGTWITTAQATDPTYWAQHLCQPVRFAAGMHELGKEPGRILLELGPGQSLGSIALQQPHSHGATECIVLPSLHAAYERQSDSAFLLQTLGKLWLAGVRIDWQKLAGGEERRRVPLPTYPFERQRYWIEPPPPLLASALRPTSSESLSRGDSQLERAAAHDIPTAPCLAHMPSPQRSHVRNAYVAPRNAPEQTIATIWQRLLGIDQVGIHDNFFELGGHSLLAPQLLSQLRDACEVELPLSLLFEAPTVAGQAETIARVRREGPAAALPGTTVELSAEVALDASIDPTGALAAEGVTDPAAVCLTGATGFLGAFVLRDLLEQTQAQIYCVVRAPTAAEGIQRIRRNLESYALWNDRFAARITPVQGDLARPLWGLSEQQFQTLARTLDVIYHCGAWVNFTYPYAALKAANVLSVQEALRLASQVKVKPLHFVSSVAVFSPGAYARDTIVREDNPLQHSTGFLNGYAATKWVAEKIIAIARQRGVPACIYRPGVIGGDSRTGIGNPKDLIWNMIKGCIQLGVIPDIDRLPDLNTMIDVTPVDYVSRGMVQLSCRSESLGQAFHFSNPRPMYWREFADFICDYGYPLRQISNEEWQEVLFSVVARSPEHALFPFMPLFAALKAEAGAHEYTEHAKDLQFDCRHTLAGLAGSGIVCPPVDSRLLAIYFAAFIRSGFLEAPSARVKPTGALNGIYTMG
jgi:phthiocerol/phenolphthiocerol synthesis type-I polyketide synthase E